MKGPLFGDKDRLSAGGPTRIQLRAADRQSGLKGIYYRIDGSPFKRYSQPFGITGTGSHTLRYYAVDRVNNKEKTKKFIFVLDKEPPKLEISYSITPRRDPASGMLILSKETLVFLTAVDTHTEVDKITYKLNDGREILYRNPLSNFEMNKVITLRAFALDRLGNVSEVKITFRVE